MLSSVETYTGGLAAVSSVEGSQTDQYHITINN